jgi:Fe-S-cluster-containing dehydrogenase component
MARNGLLIQYEYCNGCHTCEVACKQEHNLAVGEFGIKLNEVISKNKGRLRIDYIPFPTQVCNLCAGRTAKGELPSCVKHCATACMQYGPLSKLAKEMEKKPNSVIFAPR